MGIIGQETRQEFKSGGRGKLSCERSIEPVVFGLLRSLRPLKEEYRASGLHRHRGTGLLPIGGFEGTSEIYPRDQSSGSATPPRRLISRLSLLAWPWAQRIDGVIGETTPMELTECNKRISRRSRATAHPKEAGLYLYLYIYLYLYLSIYLSIYIYIYIYTWRAAPSQSQRFYSRRFAPIIVVPH